MSDLVRFSVSLEASLLKKFDRLAAREGYPTRSEAVKVMIRERLVEKEWAGDGEVVGAVTLLYDHHTRSLGSRLTGLQHEFGDAVVSTQHVHLDGHNCLEVIVVRGRAGKVRKLIAALRSVKGLKHAAFVTSSTGRTLA